VNAASLLGAGRQFSSSLGALAQLLRRSVVEVRCGRSGSGSGVVWGAGIIVTNAHCVPHATPVQINAGGTWHPARVMAYHPRHDLALLEAMPISGSVLELRDVDSLHVGELVFAHGHPLGVHDALTMGVVHATAGDRRTGGPRWIVADIRLAPGNSGGPLVDAEGRLVGINSMVVNGLGVAVPSALVRRFIARALSERAA
jgi:serine protease Do